MATVNKDFKVKNGLIVEGTTATVNNFDVLTKKQDDQDYIVSLIGGTSTSSNTPNSVVKRDGSGDFAAGTITADLIGDVTGTVSSLSNHDTDDLSEGTSNKYFTNQRALDATSAAYDPAGSASDAYNDAILWAQNYTDGEITDEVTNRNNAISTALSTAESYADTAAGNAQTAAQNYADTVAGNAQSAAETYADGVASAAQSAAQSYADNAANAAESAANTYTDNAISAEVTRSNNYADAAASTAENNAKTYADGLSSGLNWKQAVNVLATSNVPLTGSTPLTIDSHTLSNGYRVLLKGQSTDSENGIYELSITGGSYTLSRPADADVYSELVGAAVFVMEGSNYGSTAWVQAEHYLSAFSGQSWTQFSGQGTYLAGNGLTLDGTTFEIDTTITATKSYADSVAATAEGNANDYTDGKISDEVTARNSAINSAISTEVTNRNNAIDAAITTAENYTDSAISTEVTNRNNAIATAKSEAISTAEAYADGLITDEISDRNIAITNAIDALTTTDIEEGTNLYYTAARAKAEAATLLANATKTNIIITKDGSNNLTITAENGVADSTTDDLVEGTTNLYFTDARAVDALEAVTPNFPAVDINSVSRQVALSHTVPTASTHTALGWQYSAYRSGEFLVKVSYGSHTEISKVLLTLDSSNNIAITEYAMVGTNGSLASVSADIDVSTGNVRLRVTTNNNNSDIVIIGTLLV
jgi:hypothetical protein